MTNHTFSWPLMGIAQVHLENMPPGVVPEVAEDQGRSTDITVHITYPKGMKPETLLFMKECCILIGFFPGDANRLTGIKLHVVMPWGRKKDLQVVSKK